MRTPPPVLALVAIPVLACSLARSAAAAGGPEQATPWRETEDTIEPAKPWLRLDDPATFGVGIEGYAGLAAQWTRGEDRAHGVVGALARLRYHYVQVGGTYEVTDSGEATALSEPTLEHWRAVGAFVGVFFPFYRWVDVEGSVGYVSRTYGNPSSIYGSNGFELAVDALAFRVGVSGRTSRRLTGMRVGAELVATADLGHGEPVWRRQFLKPGGGLGETTGTTPIGGVSIGLVLVTGLEVGGTRR